MSRFRDAVIDNWKTENSADFAYYDSAEGDLEAFWAKGGRFELKFSQLDLSSVVEIACGQGRHSAQIVDRVGQVHLFDTSVVAIERVKVRFAGRQNVFVYLSEDGETMPFIADKSVTSVFSYDAMVHFEPLSVASYLREIHRILVPGGKALLHHSNYGERPAGAFNESPGWRNYMTKDLFCHFASRAELDVLSYEPITWAAPDSDALSMLRKPD